MGAVFSTFRDLFDRLTKKERPDIRVRIEGLDGAGKTTILYLLKLGEVITTMPTVGWNIETLKHKGLSFSVGEHGGTEGFRPLWRHYFQYIDAFIFVVDSNDRDRIAECREELREKVIEAIDTGGFSTTTSRGAQGASASWRAGEVRLCQALFVQHSVACRHTNI